MEQILAYRHGGERRRRSACASPRLRVAGKVTGGSLFLGMKSNRSLHQQHRLASGLSDVLRHLEKNWRGPAQTMGRIQRALEAAGIEFIEQDGQTGPGVRLRKPIRL